MKRSDLKIKPRRVGRGGNPELAVYYHLNPNTKTKKKGKGKKDDLKKIAQRLRQQGSRQVNFDTARTDDKEFVDVMRAINPSSKTKKPVNLSRLRQVQGTANSEGVPSAWSTDFTQPQEFAPIPEKFKGLTKPVDPDDFARKVPKIKKFDKWKTHLPREKITEVDMSWDPYRDSIDKTLPDLSWEDPRSSISYMDELYTSIDKPNTTVPKLDLATTSRNALEDSSRNSLANMSKSSLSNLSSQYHTADSTFNRSLDSSRASLPPLDSTPVPIYTSTPMQSRPGTPSIDNLSAMDVFDEPSRRALDTSYSSADSSFVGETPYNTAELFPESKAKFNAKFKAPKPEPKVFYSKPGTSSRIAAIGPEEIAEIGAPTPTPPTPSTTATNIVEDLSDAPRKLPKMSYTSALKGVGSLAGNMLANVLINEGIKKYASLFDWDKDEGSEALRETLKQYKGKETPSDSVTGSGMGINTY